MSLADIPDPVDRYSVAYAPPNTAKEIQVETRTAGISGFKAFEGMDFTERFLRRDHEGMHDPEGPVAKIYSTHTYSGTEGTVTETYSGPDDPGPPEIVRSSDDAPGSDITETVSAPWSMAEIESILEDDWTAAGASSSGMMYGQGIHSGPCTAVSLVQGDGSGGMQVTQSRWRARYRSDWAVQAKHKIKIISHWLDLEQKALGSIVPPFYYTNAPTGFTFTRDEEFGYNYAGEIGPLGEVKTVVAAGNLQYVFGASDLILNLGETDCPGLIADSCLFGMIEGSQTDEVVYDVPADPSKTGQHKEEAWTTIPLDADFNAAVVILYFEVPARD